MIDIYEELSKNNRVGRNFLTEADSGSGQPNKYTTSAGSPGIIGGCAQSRRHPLNLNFQGTRLRFTAKQAGDKFYYL